MRREIPGFPRYFVTDQGVVTSERAGAPRVLATRPNKPTDGYLLVDVRTGAGRHTRKPVLVHRLVLLAFRGQPKPGQEARHLNGDQLDNCLANLAWGTPAENHADQLRHGTRVSLTEDQVREIERRAWAGESLSALAAAFGVGQTQVGRIKRHEEWRRLWAPTEGTAA